VQHLMIDGDFANESLTTVFSSCPNISDLAIHHPFTPNGQLKWTYLLPILQEIPHLNRLTLGSLCVLSNNESLVQTFLNLTHLRMHGSMGGSWEVVTHLPKLTHLTVECVTKYHISKFLLLCPLLKLLALYHCSKCSGEPSGLHTLDDNRLVLLEGGKRCEDRILDWERGANGAVDSWIFSERIVFARGSEYSFYFSSTCHFPC